jgi:hypothetical protein
VVAVVVLLLSLALGPAGGVGAAAKCVLALLHLTVGAIVILGLPARRAVTAPATAPAAGQPEPDLRTGAGR